MSASDHMIDRVLGGYRIVDRVGAGGMGSVYKARDESLDRFVAIKTLSPALATDSVCVERFIREAKSIAAIRHPNLMHIYSVGEEDGIHFFAMEMIEGISLSKYISSRGQLPLDDALAIAGQVMGALNKVHQAGIIHRDLKPGNVMIDSDQRAVLVDFGLSKDSDAIDLTSTGSIMGTPDYMAPEQIEGEKVGPETDIYSLGVMLFEMLTQFKPFHRKSAIMTMRAHCEDTPPPAAKYRDDIPKALGAILAKAMSKKPEKRYRSIPDFAADLARICSSEMIRELAGGAVSGGDETIVRGDAGGVAKSSSSGRKASVVDGFAPTITGKVKSGKKKVGRKKKVTKRKAPVPTGLTLKQKLGYAAAISVALILCLLLLRRACRPVETVTPPAKPAPAPAEKPVSTYRPADVTGEVPGVTGAKVRIQLRNMSILDGTLIGTSGKSLTIVQHPGGNEVKIKLSDIRILRPVDNFPGRRPRRFPGREH